jgi:PleD family two-component response regulator
MRKCSSQLPRLPLAHTADEVLGLPAMRGPRVLIVEDNADACERLGLLTERRGNEVMTAADADEALRIADGFDSFQLKPLSGTVLSAARP